MELVGDPHRSMKDLAHPGMPLDGRADVRKYRQKIDVIEQIVAESGGRRWIARADVIDDGLQVGYFRPLCGAQREFCSRYAFGLMRP